MKSLDAGMPTRLLHFPSELLVAIARFLPPVQWSRSLPSLCRAMYEAELMSWSCQVSRTSVLVGRQAKTTCVKRSLSPQKAVRQAILRKSDSILLKIIYIDSVFSIMAHTILAKAIELSDGEHRRMQHLLDTITSLSNQATGVVASERDGGCIVVRKHFLHSAPWSYSLRRSSRAISITPLTNGLH